LRRRGFRWPWGAGPKAMRRKSFPMRGLRDSKRPAGNGAQVVRSGAQTMRGGAPARRIGD